MIFKLIILVLTLVVMIVINPDYAFAVDPIFITISDSMENVKFDGKWSNQIEWKESSLNTLSYDDGTEIQLRSAHKDNFIYIFVDVVSDIRLNKGADSTTICFDKNNDKNMIANTDDYCFVATLDRKIPFTLQGGSPFGSNSYFKKIPNPDGFIGIASVSDENDRYSKIPHASYEFRIPTDVVGRSDTYGFYLGVYDAHSNILYSWPEDIVLEKPNQIPSPSMWGELISPDKSLPEFHWPFIAFLAAIFLSVYFAKISQTRLDRKLNE